MANFYSSIFHKNTDDMSLLQATNLIAQMSFEKKNKFALQKEIRKGRWSAKAVVYDKNKDKYVNHGTLSFSKNENNKWVLNINGAPLNNYSNYLMMHI